MEDFLMYVSLALVLTWTIQLARAKSRNPFAWGGAAAAIMVALVALGEAGPRLLISMLPMVVLLLLKAPQTKTSPSPQGVTCARCGSNQPHGRYYCTSCGWELNRSYPDDGQIVQDPQVSATPADTPEQAPVTTTMSKPEAVEPVAGPTTPPETASPDTREETPVAATPAQEASGPPAWAYTPPPVDRSVLKPMSRGVPTAVAMTERGQNLMAEGRTQEAIDQFTKALALDASHKPALESRAAAYDSQGRNAEAEQDRQQLETAGNG